MNELEANNTFNLTPELKIVIFKQEVAIQLGGLRISISRKVVDKAVAVYKAFKEVEQLGND